MKINDYKFHRIFSKWKDSLAPKTNYIIKQSMWDSCKAKCKLGDYESRRGFIISRDGDSLTIRSYFGVLGTYPNASCMDETSYSLGWRNIYHFILNADNLELADAYK